MEDAEHWIQLSFHLWRNNWLLSLFWHHLFWLRMLNQNNWKCGGAWHFCKLLNCFSLCLKVYDISTIVLAPLQDTRMSSSKSESSIGVKQLYELLDLEQFANAESSHATCAMYWSNNWLSQPSNYVKGSK